MHLKLLGTSAAEGLPAIWCECELCRKASQLKGKDLRRRSSCLIDTDIIFDLGPDAFWQITEFGVDLTKLKRVFCSHSHPDHTNVLEFMYRFSRCFSKVKNQITVYGNAKTLSDILNTWLAVMAPGGGWDPFAITPREMKGGQIIEEPDLKVEAVCANHCLEEGGLNYIFTRGGRSLLIANDTGYWFDESFEQAAKTKLSAVLIDCTYVFNEKEDTPEAKHLTANGVLRFRNELLRRKAITENTPFIATHISHSGYALHHQMEEFFTPRGVITGYDGMVLEI